jgi:MFS family permease
VRRPSALDALSEREFRLFFTAQASSFVGDGMVPVALAFAVLEVTGSATDLGLVLAARWVPLVALLLAGGVLADRVSRRRAMIAADLMRLGAQGLLAVLLLTGGAEIWHMVVLQGVHGAATAVFNPAATGLVPLTVTAGRLQQANALRGLAQAGGEIAGPAVAGVLVATVGAGWAIAADASSFALSALCLAALRLPPQARAAGTSFLAELREGWHEFASRTWVWATVASAALGNCLFSAMIVLGPVIAERDLGGAGPWGLVLAAFGVGSFVGGIVALHVHVRRPLLVGAAVCSLAGLPLLLLAAPAPTALIAAGGLVGAAGLMIFNALWETTLQANIPEAALSRVSAYDWFGSLAFRPVGLVLVGPIAAAIGDTETLLVAGALQTLSMLALLAVPDIRRLRTREADAGRLSPAHAS